MVKTIALQVGFFLFEIGTGILVRVIFGGENKKSLEKFINSLEDTDKTGQEKFKAAREYLDKIAGSAPDIAKNMLIEAVAAKTNKQSRKLLDKFGG